MEPPSFFGRFVGKYMYLVFQIHLFRKRLNYKMAAVMLQMVPSFNTYCLKNSLFISPNTFDKYIVSKEDCISRYDDKMCFLPICRRYHIILIGDPKKSCYKNWMPSVSTTYSWTVYIHFSSTVSVTNCCQEWTNPWYYAGGNSFQPPIRRSGQNAQHREKETLEVKLQKTFVELLPKKIDGNK